MKTYPLLAFQMAILQEYQSTPFSVKFNQPWITELSKKTDVDRLADSMKRVLDNQKELHTRFIQDNTGDFRQFADMEIDIPVVRRQMHEGEAKKYISESFVRPFSPLSGIPLCRTEILETPEHNYMLLDLNRLIANDCILELLIKDIADAYDGKEIACSSYGLYEYAETEKTGFGTDEYEKSNQHYAKNIAGIKFTNIDSGTNDFYAENTVCEYVRIPVYAVNECCILNNITNYGSSVECVGKKN